MSEKSPKRNPNPTVAGPFFKIEAHKIVFTADFVVAIFVDLSAQIEIPSRLELQLELLSN